MAELGKRIEDLHNYLWKKDDQSSDDQSSDLEKVHAIYQLHDYNHFRKDIRINLTMYDNDDSYSKIALFSD